MLDVLLLARQGHNIITDNTSVERHADLEDCEVPFDPEYTLYSGAKEIVVVGGKRASCGWLTLDIPEDQGVYPHGVTRICVLPGDLRTNCKIVSRNF